MASDFLGSSSEGFGDLDGHLADLLGEYLERHATGENITEDLVRSEHPSEATELIPELEALQALSTGTDDSRTPRRLGDYRLVRLVRPPELVEVWKKVSNSPGSRGSLV